jgi:hypothetical protein
MASAEEHAKRGRRPGASSLEKELSEEIPMNRDGVYHWMLHGDEWLFA